MYCTTAAESSRVWIWRASFCSVSLATSAVCREKNDLPQPEHKDNQTAAAAIDQTLWNKNGEMADSSGLAHLICFPKVLTTHTVVTKTVTNPIRKRL